MRTAAHFSNGHKHRFRFASNSAIRTLSDMSTSPFRPIRGPRRSSRLEADLLRLGSVVDPGDIFPPNAFNLAASSGLTYF
jgi:hypothetical protein